MTEGCKWLLFCWPTPGRQHLRWDPMMLTCWFREAFISRDLLLMHNRQRQWEEIHDQIIGSHDLLLLSTHPLFSWVPCLGEGSGHVAYSPKSVIMGFSWSISPTVNRSAQYNSLLGTEFCWVSMDGESYPVKCSDRAQPGNLSSACDRSPEK